MEDTFFPAFLHFPKLFTEVLFFLFFFAVRHVGSWFPDQGLKPRSLKWKRGAPATGPPGKSHKCYFYNKK